jgi:hypothetical protein
VQSHAPLDAMHCLYGEPLIVTSSQSKPIGHPTVVQSRPHALSPSGYSTHLSMPSSVHSLSCAHGVHSWFDSGTQTNVISPSIEMPSTPRQPYPSGHCPHVRVH